MRRCTIALVWLAALFAANAAAQNQDYFQQFAHYTMRVRLDADAHMLFGEETIAYTNNSPDTLSEIYLHLYPNAFRDKNTAYMRDYCRRFNLVLFDVPKKHRSHLDIKNIRIDGSPGAAIIDDTIARIPLGRPLPPGGTLELSLEFEHKVREHLGRAGYRGEHYDFAQWYPKLVVYDENGFHPDKFATGEFYGEFGTFDVHLEVPSDYVVAATGTVVSGDPGWEFNAPGAEAPSRDGSRTVHFRAEDVHDFAWCADPTFVVQDTTWNGIQIFNVYRKRNASTWKDSTLAHGVRAMEWLTEKVGPYPYPQVSIVDALLGGGMEYPMLVMDGRASESLVLHEIGHIYFYGILGNDEREEAWLDEGFTTFQTAWYLRERYGPHGITHDWSWYKRLTPQYTRFQEYRRNVFRLQRARYGERIATRAEEFDNAYYTHVYHKAALMFNALRYVVGKQTFDEILTTYYDRWKLKHVNEARFQQVCEEVSGMDLDLFFEQWLHTRKVCDYELAEVKTAPADSGYAAQVLIKRLGEMVMPVDVVFDLDDGSTRTFRLDGRLRTIEQNFKLPAKVKRTALNPNNEIVDINLSNNFQPRRRDFQFDWPNNDFYPEDAYQIRYRPGAWYNDVDGLKAGLLLRGSYAGWGRRIRLGIYYGVESDRVDFTLSWTRPWRLFGRSASLHASGYKMEGRRDVTTSLTITHRPKLLEPPTQRATIGFNYHELTNARYLTSPELYDTSQADLGPYLNYTINPQLDVMTTRLSLGLTFGRSWGAGKFKYERFTGEITLKSRRDLIPLDVRLRLFLGLIGGDIPVSQKFNLAGAGPRRTEDRFFLRSPGAIWDRDDLDLGYHEPGDGNVRGYHEGTFGSDKLFALNFETGTKLPLFALNKLVGPVLGSLSWAAFFDLGNVLANGNPIPSSARTQALADAGVMNETLMDAGIGLRAHRNFPFHNMTLRFDVPFWVSNPEINGEEDETRARYLLSLNLTF